MIKNDFKMTVSSVDGDFNINSTGNVIDIVRGAVLTVAAIWEGVKKDGTSDAELENYLIIEFRRALECVRENQGNCEIDLK